MLDVAWKRSLKFQVPEDQAFFHFISNSLFPNMVPGTKTGANKYLKSAW